MSDPITIPPDMKIRDVIALTEQYGISGFPVVQGKEVVGIITNRDLRFEQELDAEVRAKMTPREKLVTVQEGASTEEAKRLMNKHRLERVLVVIGGLADGTKELVAVQDGQRESKLSWANLLQDLKRRGLQTAPKLAVADGGLGFWAALAEEFPETQEQRCWVHKTANVLDKLPKSVQPDAKNHLHQMYLSPTRKLALEAYDRFQRLYQAKHPKACECLKQDKEQLFRFYDFPAEHWGHLRTTNPIESTFAQVRHRTRQTKGCGSVNATLAMVFQLVRVAEKHWRRLNGHHLLSRLVAGIRFVDGVEQKEKPKAA